MSTPHLPKVAGIDPTVPAPAHTATPLPGIPAAASAPHTLIQDRLAGWVSDLTTLHELTERLARTGTLDDALHELLRAGAALVGARRGMAVLEPADGHGPVRRSAWASPTPNSAPSKPSRAAPRPTDASRRPAPARTVADEGSGRDLTSGGQPRSVSVPDLLGDEDLDPRHREVAARLGFAASYAVPLVTDGAGRLGAAVWLYDEPAEPTERRRHLVGLYGQYASEHLARLLELERGRARIATLAEELMPSRLPRVPGVRLAGRHVPGSEGGGDWYDALALPEGALGLAVGSVCGSGPSALAAMGRLRASLRAYAVMEGRTRSPSCPTWSCCSA